MSRKTCCEVFGFSCNQGRTCPARVRLTAERAVPAILARVVKMLKGEKDE